MLQFKHLLAPGIILLAVAISSDMNSAYGHGCQGHGFTCFTPWPNGVLSTYSEVISIVSVVGLALAVAMLIFKFDYLRRKDFYVTKYSPTSDRINRLLFEGRDKRKIIAAMPFLIFGCYIVAFGLYSIFTYGNLRNVDFAIMIASFSSPFFTIGGILLVFGLKAISFVTLKKEAI